MAPTKNHIVICYQPYCQKYSKYTKHSLPLKRHLLKACILHYRTQLLKISCTRIPESKKRWSLNTGRCLIKWQYCHVSIKGRYKGWCFKTGNCLIRGGVSLHFKLKKRNVWSLFYSIWGVGLRNDSYLSNRASFLQSESSVGKKIESHLG